MAKTLAVQYRPQTFEEVVAQEEIKTILQEQLATNTFKNQYLFCGASGCGKTTLARIFANEINKGKGHPIEIDAASNNGVENIRGIIEDAKKKSLDSEYKIYILDEVHMLTLQSWNALLKLIEEPPKYTVFLFCTTDPQKIPETILNRVQRYDFTKIPYDMIVSRLKYICGKENILIVDDALSFIAKLSGGGMRTAIAYLDKVQSLTSKSLIQVEDVVRVLGTADYDALLELLDELCNYHTSNAISIIEEVYNSGKDLKNFLKQFFTVCVDACKYKLFNTFDYLQIPKLPEYEKILDSVDKSNCFYTMEVVKNLMNIIKYDSNVLYTVEGVLISSYEKHQT